MATKTQQRPAPRQAAKPQAKAPAPSKAVARVQPKNQQVAAPDYGAHAGAGAEDITKADFLIPFVRVAQANSPQTKKAHEKYFQGCKEGDFFNVNTGRIYGGEEGFPLYICAKQRYFAEFIPRNEDGSGGGFAGTYLDTDPVVLDLIASQGRNKALTMENGNDLVETYALYCVVPGDDENPDPEMVVLPFSSSGITPVKQALMILDPLIKKGIPMFAPRMRLSSRGRVKGNLSWVVPVFQFDGESAEDYLLEPDDALIQVCADFRAAVSEGRAKADHASDTGDETAEDGPAI